MDYFHLDCNLLANNNDSVVKSGFASISTISTVGRHTYDDNESICSMYSSFACDQNVTIKHLSSFSSNEGSEKRGGRTPGMIYSVCVTYKGKQYDVITLQYRGGTKCFVCDSDDMPRIEQKSWHISSGKYIGTNIKLADGTIKEVYIHNYILNRDDRYSDKRRYVIHINGNTLDNRKANLLLVNEEDLHKYKAKKKRTVAFPEGAGIKAEDIPRYISYVKSSGCHGDRFSIEIAGLGINYKCSSSKSMSLLEKLEEAKSKLDMLKSEYPEYFKTEGADASVLREEYEEILRLSGVCV